MELQEQCVYPLRSNRENRRRERAFDHLRQIGAMQLWLFAAIIRNPKGVYGTEIANALNGAMKRSGAARPMDPRHIYAPINRLIEMGMVESYVPQCGNQRTRKYYRATKLGREAFQMYIGTLNEMCFWVSPFNAVSEAD